MCQFKTALSVLRFGDLNFKVIKIQRSLQIFLCFLDTKTLFKISDQDKSDLPHSGRHCQKGTQSCHSKQKPGYMIHPVYSCVTLHQHSNLHSHISLLDISMNIAVNFKVYIAAVYLNSPTLSIKMSLAHFQILALDIILHTQ